MKTVKVIDNVETGLAARRERSSHLLTQRYIADGMGITNITYSNLENGNAPWSDAYIDAFNRTIARSKK